MISAVKGDVYIETENIFSDLQKAVDQGILDIGAVREQLQMKRRAEILETHPYQIYQGSDGKWRTYVPDPTKKAKRRLLKRGTEDELKEALVSSYQNIQQSLTLEKLYPEWLYYYSLHCESAGSVQRVTVEWKKHYKGNSLVKKPLSSLKKIELETWVLEIVRRESMNKKQYFNMSLPLRQMLKYAYESEYIIKNPFENVRISSKLFKKEKKKADETQVYTPKEERAIIDLAWSEYRSDPAITTPLALIFLFYTGTRIGEVVAFKDTDLEGNYIWVNRMERKCFTCDDKLVYHQKDRSIVDHAKTDAGHRKIYLVKEARYVVTEAVASAKEKGCEKDFFLFQNEKSRITGDCITSRLRKYCRMLEIPFRSPHKIRKTYISKLIDSGVNINTIRELAGHEDERTTYHNYCFNRNSRDETNEQLENALEVFSGIQKQE